MTDDTARADPLSPQWERCKVCGGDHWTHDHDSPRAIRERAARPSGLLRERLTALLDRWEADGQGDLVSATAVRAALAATEPGLDVERLARAMDVVVPESIPPLYWTNERLARAIAAEYARLARLVGAE